MIGNSIVKFYDVTFFSSDEIVVGEDYPVIAEMYFRIKADSVKHQRTVFSIMNWLGAIGGIEGILYDFAALLLGGFIQYNAVI